MPICAATIWSAVSGCTPAAIEADAQPRCNRSRSARDESSQNRLSDADCCATDSLRQVVVRLLNSHFRSADDATGPCLVFWTTTNQTGLHALDIRSPSVQTRRQFRRHTSKTGKLAFIPMRLRQPAEHASRCALKDGVDPRLRTTTCRIVNRLRHRT